MNPKVLMQLVVHPNSIEVVWDEGMRAELLRNGDMRLVLEVLATEITRQADAARAMHDPNPGPVN